MLRRRISAEGLFDWDDIIVDRFWHSNNDDFTIVLVHCIERSGQDKMHCCCCWGYNKLVNGERFERINNVRHIFATL